MPDAIERSAPCPSETADDGAVCKRCHRRNAVGADRCAWCKSTLKGNKLALKHGLHASNNTPQLRAIERRGGRLARQSIRDAGGIGNMVHREVTQHLNRATVQVQFEKLAHALNIQGQFDRRGRLHDKWLAQLQSLGYLALAIDKELGWKRKPKESLSLAEWLTRPVKDQPTELVTRGREADDAEPEAAKCRAVEGANG